MPIWIVVTILDGRERSFRIAAVSATIAESKIRILYPPYHYQLDILSVYPDDLKHVKQQIAQGVNH